MSSELLTNTIEGAAAGVVGTLLLQAMVLPAERYLPSAHPPQSMDPAEFMLWQVEKRLPRRTWLSIPRKAETVAGFGLSFGYGAAFGAMYGAMKRRNGHGLLDGAILGLTCWAVGYLGWLPATGLIPKPKNQTSSQLAGPMIEHVAFGIATVAACQFLQKKW